MKRRLEVKRYAKMFLNSIGIDAAPGSIQELGMIRALMEKSREFRGLLENPLFTGDERGRVLRDISGRLKLSESTVKFVLFLSEQAVIASLPELIQGLTAMYLEKKKKARATVVTPVDTGRRYDAALRSSLKRLTGRDVDIEYVVDPSLLGGVLIKVGSTMYDSSIKGQLRLLKDDLITR